MSRSAAEKFVDRVYRRLVIYRTLEQFGLGILLASALAIVLNLLAIWQSMATLPILIFSAGVGLVFGLALAIYRWPTRLSAITQADQQLRFDDLLTSAMFPTKANTGDFSIVVRAMADVKCQQHSPNEVFVRRLNARTWSAIGLAMSVAVTLGVIPFGAVRSQAVDANAAVLSSNPAASGEISRANKFQQINEPASEVNWNADISSEQKSDVANSNLWPSKSTRDVKYGSGPGGGAVTVEPRSNLNQQSQTGVGTKNGSGDAAGGGATSGNGAQRGDPSNSRQGAANTSQNSTLKWSGDPANYTPPNAIAPTDDRVPVQDRDLIRDFFDSH